MKTKTFPVSQGVSIVTIGSKKDRCTIGYRRVNRMIQVAVSYCAPGDKWKAVTGQTIVCDRLTNSISGGYDEMGAPGVISLPAGSWEDVRIQEVLVYMFFGFEDVNSAS